LENNQFLPPQFYSTKLQKPDQFAYTFLDNRFLERIPLCMIDLGPPPSSTHVISTYSKNSHFVRFVSFCPILLVFL
jgi:hypothetical protein